MAAAAGAGAALAAIGSVVQGAIGFAQYQYQRGIALRNQQVAKVNARTARERAAVAQVDQDRLTLQMLGDQEAKQGASGINLLSRSSIRTRKTARELGRRDALNVKQKGEIQAYNYENQAADFAAAAAAAGLSSFGSLIGGFLDARSSLIGTSSPTAFSTGSSVPLPRPRPQLVY